MRSCCPSCRGCCTRRCSSGALPRESPALLALLAEQRRTNRLLQGALWAALGFVAGLVLMQAASRWWG